MNCCAPPALRGSRGSRRDAAPTPMTPKPTGWDEPPLAENPAVELLQFVLRGIANQRRGEGMIGLRRATAFGCPHVWGSPAGAEA